MEEELKDAPAMIFVPFKKPVRENYHVCYNASKENSCAPLRRGDGCLGDCGDCYRRDVSRFLRLAKHQKEMGLKQVTVYVAR